MKVLVTGASGFIGGHLCEELLKRGHEVSAGVRREGSAPLETAEIVVGDIDEITDWSTALNGQEAVVHLAARVHVMTETAEDPLAEFRRINTMGTLNLATAAQLVGVSRFLFLSSIKVNGESTTTTPFSVDDAACPLDPYGISKWEAEQGIMKLAGKGPTNFVTIRTPLVYGPGVAGNFRRLMTLIDKRIPIPLRGVKNRRAMVSVWNLADLFAHVLGATNCESQTILVSDKEKLSTPDLIRTIGHGMDKPVRLVGLPVSVLRLVGRLLGKSGEVDRLVGSLDVTVGSTSAEFDWSPPVRAQDGIERTALHWASSRLGR